MLKRINGIKYLEIDNSRSIIHACSCVETYFDRYSQKEFGDLIEKTETFVHVLNVNKIINDYEEAECCFCGCSNKVNALFPNDTSEIKCINCNKDLSFYVIQMTSSLENKLGMQNSNGRAIIWLTTPKNNPEFKNMLHSTNVSIGLPIKFYLGDGVAPWWFIYKKISNSVSKDKNKGDHNKMGLFNFKKKAPEDFLQNLGKIYNRVLLLRSHNSEKVIELLEEAHKEFRNYKIDDDIVGFTIFHLAEAYYNLGVEFTLNHDYKKAIDFYKKSISWDKNFYMSYYNIGNAYYELGNQEKELEWYNKTLEIHPYLNAYHNIGIIYYERMDKKKAISYFIEAAKLGHMDSIEILRQRGILY